jgi:small subunit ribosomal protein S9
MQSQYRVFSSIENSGLDRVTSSSSLKDKLMQVPSLLVANNIDELGRAYGTGRRKTSVARVWVNKGSGQFYVNGKLLVDYFLPIQREECLLPFLVVNQAGVYDVNCTVKGGGISGQAGAIRLGISRALTAFDPSYRVLLKNSGLLTRDSRRVERKKPGQPKARKNFQWVKR